MSIERDALLSYLPTPWRKDALPVPVFQVLLAQAGTVRVADGRLDVVDGSGVSLLSVDLDDRHLTMAQLFDTIVATPLLGAVALADDITADQLAGSLLDTEDVVADGGGAVQLFRWSSPTWRLLDPARRQLVEKVAKIDIGLAQGNLLTSAGDFADWWARWLGAMRREGEGDATFTARQLRELIRPRENNLALATLLEAEFGVTVVEVIDLRPLVFVASRTPLRGHPLRGWRYNSASIEVRLIGFPSAALIALARQQLAAGITAFFLGVYDLEAVPAAYDFAETPIVIGTPPAMQIGPGRIGVGKIGPP